LIPLDRITGSRGLRGRGLNSELRKGNFLFIDNSNFALPLFFSQFSYPFQLQFIIHLSKGLTTADDFLGFLTDWFVGHTIYEDQKLFKAI